MYEMSLIKQRFSLQHGLKESCWYNSDVFQYTKEKKQDTMFHMKSAVSYNFTQH
jgi:hypothetical protein